MRCRCGRALPLRISSEAAAALVRVMPGDAVALTIACRGCGVVRVTTRDIADAHHARVELQVVGQFEP